MNKRAKSNSIRLIAGQWRGRRLPVLDSPGLRPTTDRVRETLFNWLMHDIADARCLDLFAGSGALGLECLSRGAQFVQFVESQRRIVEQLQANLLKLECAPSRANCICQDALKFTQTPPSEPYDLIFLDPPFSSDIVPQLVSQLSSQHWLSPQALIYLEQPSHQAVDALPSNWQLFKDTKAGQSHARLYRIVTH